MENINLGVIKILTSEQKCEIIKLNKENVQSRKIAKQLNIGEDAVYKFLKKNNLKSPKPMKKLNINDVEFIKKKYLEGLTIKQIHEKYFRGIVSSENINYHLKQAGITRKACKVSILNHDYFEVIDTEEKAYWLGFLTADGCVQHHKNKGESYSIRLELKTSDKYMVENFANAIETDRIVRDYIKDKKSTSYITVFSKKMFNDLGKHNVIPNKTLSLENIPNTIPDELIRHFIRGYFDGDGTVYNYICKGKNKLVFGFYGTEKFLNSIKSRLIEDNVIVSEANVYNQKEANVSMLLYTIRDDIKRFFDYIYSDSSIYLTRKYDKFKQNM